MKMIAGIQIKLIHIALGQLGIDDTSYRSMLSNWFNVSSSKALSYEQATRLIEEFNKKGFKSASKAKKKTAKWKGKEVRTFDSSHEGLLQEVEHYAQQRWGEGWIHPLNALCKTIFKMHTYKWIGTYRLIDLKKAILNLEASGPYAQEKREDPF
jgi:hypothetical protein